MKGTDKKISMITAYDYTMAKIVDESGVNTILVGDSLGNTILGYEDTISVTVDDMIHHSAAVARGAKNALVITDMPFMSYQTSVYDAVVNAGRIMKEGRAGAVKLEGGQDMCPQISAIVKASIPVCAHLGLTPQSINAFGGFKVQGKTEAAAKKLIEVFNTVPHQVLDEALLAELPPDCLLIELASASGFDMDAVETLRLSYLKAGGLPGRVAPETAARAIKKTLCRLIKEEA